MTQVKKMPEGLPRWVEVSLAAVGLIVLSPLLAGIALAIRIGSRGPALFRQLRVGRQGEEFVLLKFRSMKPDATGSAVTAAGDPRITTIGRWLRKTKLDELPELWNVVNGTMSLVGPRPEVREYVDLDSPKWQETLRVAPGITDPTTLVYRHEEEILANHAGDRERYYRQVVLPDKLNGYVRYLRQRSWWTDCKVLVATLWRIFGVKKN